MDLIQNQIDELNGVIRLLENRLKTNMDSVKSYSYLVSLFQKENVLIRKKIRKAKLQLRKIEL